LILDITCKTDQFNLSVVGPDFINDCCFGEDFSKCWCPAFGGWRRGKSHLHGGLRLGEPGGYQGATYLMCVAGNSDEEPGRPDYGEWHVMLERHRTLMQKLLGKDKISASDPIVGKVREVLLAAGFEPTLEIP
jgi:hypothetical protein